MPCRDPEEESCSLADKKAMNIHQNHPLEPGVCCKLCPLCQWNLSPDTKICFTLTSKCKCMSAFGESIDDYRLEVRTTKQHGCCAQRKDEWTGICGRKMHSLSTFIWNIMQPKISMLPYDASNSSMYAVCICYKYRQIVIRYFVYVSAQNICIVFKDRLPVCTARGGKIDRQGHLM